MKLNRALMNSQNNRRMLRAINRRRTTLGAALVSALLVAIVMLPHFAVAQRQGFNLSRDVGLDQKLNEQVPLQLQFLDQAGAVVRLEQYFDDKPVLLSLVYHECPMLCNMSQDGLVRSLRALSLDVGRDFTLLTVSFDPTEGPDIAARKRKKYLEHYGRAGADEGWHFLTGDKNSIEQLTDAVGFRYAYDPQTGQYAHAAGIIVLTPQGRVSRYFYGIEYPPRDLRFGLVEASESKIGSVTDRVLLFCYQYDPTTGKYGLAIIGALRIGGALTVLVLGGFIVIMIRRERIRAKEQENNRS